MRRKTAFPNGGWRPSPRPHRKPICAHPASKSPMAGVKLLVAGFCLLGLAQPAAVVSAADLKVVRDDATFTIQQGDQVLLVYQRAPAPYKVYVKQWYTPAGLQVLRDSPHDHVHHHALMYAIGVDGVDFWGEAPRYHPGKQIPRGDDSVAVTRRDGSPRVTIRQTIDWVGPEGNPLMCEQRSVTLCQGLIPGASFLIWDSRFAPAEGRDSVKLWGRHYFGLGMRLVTSMDKAGRFRNAAAEAGHAIRGNEKAVRAQWCAYTAPVGDRPVTIAMFDHPSNARHPATWFTMTTPFAYLSATLNLAEQPMVLARGKPLHLRYGVALWDGEIPTDRIERAYAAWVRAVVPDGDNAAASKMRSKKEKTTLIAAARQFLKEYQDELARLDTRANLAMWKAANSGKKEDFDASAAASLALRKFHSDPDAYRRVCEFMTVRSALDPVEARALVVAELSFRRNQLPPELLEKMVALSTEIERLFNTYRADMDGKEYTNNDLLEMIRKETDSGRRKKMWEALKQVGGVVAPKLIELARLRNQAARHLGFRDYWDMAIRLQEHDPERLLAVFDELEQLTREPFAEMKRTMDRELAARFHIEPEATMPWHYDNPFFQAAPPSAKVNLDEFYEDKSGEDLVTIARRFYEDIGLPIEEVLARSDLFEREGKDQHAFCINIDRAGDVRTLCNIKPTAEWMDTMLHEQGHAVYDLGIDRKLPYNLREPAHIFTTEGVAMLFGALAKTPAWMIAYAGADRDRVEMLADAIREQRRREQLIFARWTLVMLHFEKALYEDPDRDLNTLWWDYKERFQQLKRPPERDRPDWAAKPHFTIAPVYYHNYMLGELFAAQLRAVLARLAGHQGPASELSFNGRKEFGRFLKDRVFEPGSRWPWPKFVEKATGESLTARHFAVEVR